MIHPLRARKGPHEFIAALGTALVSGGLSVCCLADVRDPGFLGCLYAALVVCHLADGGPSSPLAGERNR
jgi:hypothetical protein